jgi:hypothetical protein
MSEFKVGCLVRCDVLVVVVENAVAGTRGGVGKERGGGGSMHMGVGDSLLQEGGLKGKYSGTGSMGR